MKVSSIEPNAVHVWHLDLALGEEALHTATALLSPEEQLTASYFREARHRDRFVAGRALLKQLLAAYMNTTPETLNFEWSSNGKPALATAADQPELFFNFSHSADRAVCAVTHIGPIGIDLEHLQEWDDLRALEQLVFTEGEIALLERLAESERDKEFFRLWTHKEALVKATGEGLSLAPETFGVNLEDACLFPCSLEDGGWRFSDVSRSSDWPAAIALACDDYTVRQFS